MVDKSKMFLQLLAEEMTYDLGHSFSRELSDGTRIDITDEVVEKIVNDEKYSDKLYAVFSEALEDILDDYWEKQSIENMEGM